MHKKIIFQKASNFIAAFTIVMLVLAALPITPAYATTVSYDSSTTWTAPAGVTSVTVYAWGGGGAGGGTINGGTEDAGGGGGGGAISVSTISVIPGRDYNVNIGAGGAASSGAAGGNGGQTTFVDSVTSTTLVSANGGGGGGVGSSSGPGAGGVGGTTAGTGTTKWAGGTGGTGRNVTTTSSTARSGAGGGSAGDSGAGGDGQDGGSGGAAAGGSAGTGTTYTGTDGADGTNSSNVDGVACTAVPGCGGSGASGNTSSDRIGGNGAGGRIIITYTITLLDQTITVTTSAPGSAGNGSSFDVAASSDSGLPVTITTTGGVCSGGGDGTATITMTSATGTCTVHYNQAGNGSYNPAPEVTENVTATAAACYALTLSSSANGGDPVASPLKSAACASNGQYVAGELIGLTASPDPGYRVAGWTGTNNDFSLSTTNAVTMPASARSVNVSYDVVSNKTYYVDKTNPSCSDLGAGTQAVPFCTIGKGASIALAGDTVQVLAGTYAETVNGPNSGNIGNPITYSAAAGVTVTGNGTATGSGFRMTSKSYIVVDGFTIIDTKDDGIYVNSSNHITISNNHVSYSGSRNPDSTTTRQGIYFTNTSDSLITGNTSDHNSQDGIRLTGSSTNVTVSNNVSFANAEQWQRNATGIQVVGPDAANNTIIHNITYANEDSGLQFYAGAHDNLVLGNVSYGNGDHGIDFNAASPNNIVVGNTVQGNVTAGINLEGASAPGSGGATVVNNILVDNGLLLQVGGGTPSGQAGNLRVDAQSLTGTTLDYNIFYLNSGTVQIIWGDTSYATLAAFQGAVSGQETHQDLQADPLFVAPAPVAQRPASAPYNVAVNVGDYHLTAGSLAIDSANSDAPNEPTTDIEGNARVDDPITTDSGAGTRTYDDRGAYEYQPPICYALTLSHTGQGSDPIASPANSSGCLAGQYVAGATINLNGAVPATGWQIASWTGTGNDASTASTNTVTMPASAHSASVNYTAICYALTLSHTGQGTDPVASPANSSGCSAGQYVMGATINLSGATPDTGWQIASWTGTNNNASTASTNTVTMPASARTASVNYVEIIHNSDTTGVFRPSNGLLYLKNKNTTGFADIAINYGLGGDYPVTGDWDGNGTDTIGIYRNGVFYLRNSNTIGFADLVFPFGTPGDQPIAGDWNGDGVDTIGVYRPSTGQFLLRNSNTAGAADMSFYLGNVGDVGIAGDWNGDGIDTTGVFRPSNGVIFLKNTNSTGYADIALNYGLPGDQPVTGDWNGDGIDTIGIYRNGTFYLRNSNTIGFADIVFGLGNPGDMPISGDWDGLP